MFLADMNYNFSSLLISAVTMTSHNGTSVSNFYLDVAAVYGILVGHHTMKCIGFTSLSR